MKNSKVILHITDVHFSSETTHESDARTLALGQLVQTIADLPDDWHPSIVCLTGDIARRGKAADYELAQAWLTTLLSRFALTIVALFICAGNHDVDRDVAQLLARPGSSGEADTILAFPPISEHYAGVFEPYSKWAEQFGIRPYKLG